jgi:hypothetical protein
MACDASPAFSLTGDYSIVRGASYAFGLIPSEIVAPATTATLVWPLTGCSLSATLFRDAACNVAIIAFTVTLPTAEGDPILCTLTPDQTAALPHTPEGTTFWVKALLTRADGTVEPRAYGPAVVTA